MKYQEIPTFQQRLQTSKPTSEADIQLHLHEEIAELRHFIEWHILPKKQLDFSKVRTITLDGRCMGWDGNEINTAA